MHVTVMGNSNEQNVVPGADEEVISVDVNGVVRKFPSFSLDVSFSLCCIQNVPIPSPWSDTTHSLLPVEEKNGNRLPIIARGYSQPRG